jgi:hypothetical protein
MGFPLVARQENAPTLPRMFEPALISSELMPPVKVIAFAREPLLELPRAMLPALPPMPPRISIWPSQGREVKMQLTANTAKTHANLFDPWPAWLGILIDPRVTTLFRRQNEARIIRLSREVGSLNMLLPPLHDKTRKY